MERSQQRLATLEREKVALLARLQVLPPMLCPAVHAGRPAGHVGAACWGLPLSAACMLWARCHTTVLLSRACPLHSQDGAGSVGAGGEGGAPAPGAASRATEDSLRQELYAQVGWMPGQARSQVALVAPTCLAGGHSAAADSRRRACLPNQPRLPVLLSSLQRELATRLQSEVSALRQQLESGEWAWLLCWAVR